jgi:anti-sigma factor RsiW
MSDPTTQLERLISRYLDHESTPAERRELRGRLARDPHADALFEDYNHIDREVRHAMRAALGRSLAPIRSQSGWRRVAQYAGLAIAACIATLVWLRPMPDVDPGGNDLTQAGALSAHSWFAPLPAAADTVAESSNAFEQAGIGLSGTDREWIVLPGKDPGEFIVIQVDRVRCKYIHVQRDF